MSMTTPPGWYPDPGNPAVEHWWDGAAWTGHTRTASPATVVIPPRPARRTGRLIAFAAAGVAVAAVTAVVVIVLGSDEEPPVDAANSPAPPPTSSAPAPTTAAPTEDATVVVDQLNGITLPILGGWEKPERTADDLPTVSTVAADPCPAASSRTCKRGSVFSLTATATGTTDPEAIAKEDIAKAADRAFEADSLGVRPHGGIRSHKVLAERPAVVAGRTGYLVRWQVTTNQGPGGYVQSLAFPSSLGSESPVIVRFVFSAGPGAPPPATMDEITKGIRPIGSSTGGGVGSSIGP
ncbi:DUF2510 domain-containing protein [Streptomyces sp. CB03238]|uniref:DUF2510 domain-containing protein n=1 Tax=Streptomyces sp. CB03238 TaxID=1907777 RepID=UPI000A108D0E|nr:DUF2510 domain-containing protein [Streptomyces sp. CB03238]ORT59966.1 hypothetical protein BKD26_10180 [Streptomyces sp. CB03238]